MAKKYVDVNQMLIDESEAYMSAQLKVNDMVRKINQIVHMKLQQLLIDAPAADVQEVRHGKWIKEENGVIICSECGEEHEWDDYRSSYCEFCGARMDGEINA